MAGRSRHSDMKYSPDIRKDYFWNTLGTSAVSFLSLLLSIAVTRINGIDTQGVFTLCFSFAILFFTIGLYGGRIYQVSDVIGEFENRTYIYLKFITSAAMIVTAFVFAILSGYDGLRFTLLISLVVYKMLDAIADPLYGVMQRNGCLYLAGISMTLKAVIGFVAFLAINLMTHNILYASLCLLGANLIFIAVFDIPNVRRLENITGLFSGNIKPSLILLKASVYIFAFSLLSTLLLNIPRYYMDVFHSEALLGFFNIVVMPASIMSLFVTFVIQPKLVPLSERFAAAEYAGFNKTVMKLIIISLIFGIFAIAAAWLIGIPVLSFIYGVDTSPYRVALTISVTAGTINTITMVLSNILSIMRRFKIQLFNYLAGTAGLFAACLAFIRNGSVDGAIQAFLIANAIQAVLFLISYLVTYRRVSKSLPRTSQRLR